MKKLMLIAAAATMLFAGCAPKQTSEEILDGFQTQVNEWMDSYRTDVTAINANEALTAEEKEDKIVALQDSIMEKISAAGKEILRKHPSDTTVVPVVLGNIYSYMEDDELEAVIASLGKNVKQMDIVTELSNEIAVRKATAVGSKFVDFTVDHVAGVDAEGNPVIEQKSLSDFVGKGKVMLVDFWSPWCPPCKAEIPNIKAVWEKYNGEDFDVLSVAVWEESRKMTWRNTIDTAAFYGVKWQQLNNGHKEPAALYGITGIPHMILFDKEGKILKRGDDLRGANLDPAVAEALGR